MYVSARWLLPSGSWCSFLWFLPKVWVETWFYPAPAATSPPPIFWFFAFWRRDTRRRTDFYYSKRKLRVLSTLSCKKKINITRVPVTFGRCKEKIIVAGNTDLVIAQSVSLRWVSQYYHIIENLIFYLVMSSNISIYIVSRFVPAGLCAQFGHSQLISWFFKFLRMPFILNCPLVLCKNKIYKIWTWTHCATTSRTAAALRTTLRD